MTATWENSPLEYHKQYMESEWPELPSLKDLWHEAYENPFYDDDNGGELVHMFNGMMQSLKLHDIRGIDLNIVDVNHSHIIHRCLSQKDKITKDVVQVLLKGGALYYQGGSKYAPETLDIGSMIIRYLERHNPCVFEKTVIVKRAGKD